jgi:hypothetical protein
MSRIIKKGGLFGLSNYWIYLIIAIMLAGGITAIVVVATKTTPVARETTTVGKTTTAELSNISSPEGISTSSLVSTSANVVSTTATVENWSDEYTLIVKWREEGSNPRRTDYILKYNKNSDDPSDLKNWEIKNNDVWESLNVIDDTGGVVTGYDRPSPHLVVYSDGSYGDSPF